jgi:Tfp pilus assembly protein PilF
MNKLIILSTALLLSVFASAQPDDAKNLQQTARSFMQSGDFNNAIIVLNRALQTDKHNLELLKDLAMTYYLKQDYTKSYEVVKQIVDCDDADVQVYQIAGNVYRAIEMVKECDKMYKKALKKFPNSGPLYSEYGELLWQKKISLPLIIGKKG